MILLREDGVRKATGEAPRRIEEETADFHRLPGHRVHSIIETRAQESPYVVQDVEHGTVLGKALVLAFVEMLATHDWTTAADALAVMKSEKALPGLIARLDDRDHKLREHAARTLGRISNPAALRALQNLLDDEVHTVRETALVAIKSIADNGDIDALKKANNAGKE